MSTEDTTYTIVYTTDVQCELDDSAQIEEFSYLEQTVREIQIVLDGKMGN